MQKLLPWISIGLLVSALAIFAYKIYLSNTCRDLCKTDDGRLTLNESFFNDQVVARYPQIRNWPIHLLVFADLEHDCMAHLFESPEWVAPLAYSDVYNVTLFLPESHPESLIHGYLETYGLSDEQIIRFSGTDAVARLRKFDLIKILYTQENQVEWIQPANSQSKAYEVFEATLRKRIRSFEEELGIASR